MGTKVTIKSRAQEGDKPGYHLYSDLVDEMACENKDDAPIYLRLEGVELELQTLCAGPAILTVTLPKELARTLGLVP